MLGIELDQNAYLQRLADEIARVDQQAVQRWADLLFSAWEREATVYIIGNGGSGTTASHIAEDLGKSTLPESELSNESRKRLRVLSLTDNAGWLMAVGNDLGYEQIFVQQLMNYGREGDCLIAISGSGNSPNILRAVEWADRHGLHSFGLSGYSGGKLKEIQHDGIHLDLPDMGMVESIHLCLFHWVLNDLHARINQVGRFAPA